MSDTFLTSDLRSAFGVLTDLINTSPERAGVEGMADSESLGEMMDRWDISFARVDTASELTAMRHLRTRLERILAAGSIAQVMDQINEMFFSSASTPQVVVHEGNEEPHMHFSLDDAPFVDKITALTANALAQLVVKKSFNRLRECANDDCRMVFIDTSKNGSRMYHDSQSCGNRLHAARYRDRQASLANS